MILGMMRCLSMILEQQGFALLQVSPLDPFLVWFFMARGFCECWILDPSLRDGSIWRGGHAATSYGWTVWAGPARTTGCYMACNLFSASNSSGCKNKWIKWLASLKNIRLHNTIVWIDIFTIDLVNGYPVETRTKGPRKRCKILKSYSTYAKTISKNAPVLDSSTPPS